MNAATWQGPSEAVEAGIAAAPRSAAASGPPSEWRPSGRVRAALGRMGAVGLLAAIYLLGARAALPLAGTPAALPLLSPTAGIALFALLWFGPGLWPGVALGAFVGLVTRGMAAPLAAVIALGNAAAAFGGVALLGRVRPRAALERVRDVVAFAGLGAGASALVSASVGVAALVVAGAQSATPSSALWAAWWSSDAAAILVVTPLLLLWAARPTGPPVASWRVAEALAALLVLASLTVWLSPEADSVAYLVLPVVVWFAFRYGRRGAATAVAVIAVLAAVEAHRVAASLDPVSALALLHPLRSLEASVGCTAVLALLFAAVRSERDAARLALGHYRGQSRALERLEGIGTWYWDRATGVLTWSPELRRMCGAPGEGVTGAFDAFLEVFHVDDRPLLQQRMAQSLADGRGFDVLVRVPTADGAGRLFVTRGEVVLGGAGVPAGVAGVCHDVTERVEGPRAEERLRTLLAGAEARERARIARELHDEAGQSLTALRVALQLVRNAGSLALARRHAARLDRIAGQLFQALGGLARGLPPKLVEELGLASAVIRYAREFAALHGIATDVRASGWAGERAPAPVETAIYRIIVEALTNVARHSDATAARVELYRRAGFIEASVWDDGRGCDVAAILERTGRTIAVGLHGMIERAASVDGTVAIDSRPARGTTVSLRIPWGPARDA